MWQFPLSICTMSNFSVLHRFVENVKSSMLTQIHHVKDIAKIGKSPAL
uniref:Uncharacterized protein n=1 Tax=Rhizophora mucronata TaxID=61149 RepID=A0A2P2QLB1_RHIMU